MPSQADEGKDPIEDPMADWSSAYRRLDAPLIAEELVDADPRTRAAVGWMQMAWSQLDVPEPRVPQRAPRRLAPAQRILAMAAAILLLLLGAWALGGVAALLEAEPERVASHEVPAEQGGHALDSEASAGQRDQGKVLESEHERAALEVQQARLEGVSVEAGRAENNMEFRSGRVTLVLVTGA